jgi:DNA-binding transcriptional MerR regulator
MTDTAAQDFSSMGEVCELTGLKQHVLRYWESQFRFLNPAKNRSGNRVYQRKEIELIQYVKHLLYTEKYTIEGARQKIDDHRKDGALRAEARGALGAETLVGVEQQVADLLAVLDGSKPIPESLDNGEAMPE